MPRSPSDGDEVAWYVEPTLRTEHDVMQGRVLNVSTADAAALSVSLDHEVPYIGRDESLLFEFDL